MDYDVMINIDKQKTTLDVIKIFGQEFTFKL